jgi:aspartyl-tRNA(Asn)/glutamyl-tRNA(Gln) amidotransferase subunit A
MIWLDGDPADLTIAQAQTALRSGQLTAAELVEATLTRAERTEPLLHAWVKLTSDAARATAERQDDAARGGVFAGPLHGIPLGIKDIFDVAGLPTKCNSKSRSRVKNATEDATSVDMLKRSGGIVIGKTVTQEFAAGVVSHPARNPWDPNRIPGGSSGGSAAVVSVGSALAAMGSDTGGSIRIPASVCGTAGLKPTFGVLSTKGVFPLSWSLDTLGPLARNAEDAYTVYAALAGIESSTPLQPLALSAVRIGISHPHFFERLQPGVYAAVREAIAMIASGGALVVDAPWHDARAARAAGFIINRAETEVVHREGVRANPKGYGPTLVERVRASSLVPASGLLRAHQARTVVRGSIEQVFLDHGLDVMMSPATPATALPAGDLYADYPGESAREPVALAYTRMSMPFNLTGQPVLVIPCGFDDAGLPVGLQIAARPFDEARLCRIGMAIERVFIDHFGEGWTRPPLALEVAQ